MAETSVDECCEKALAYAREVKGALRQRSIEFLNHLNDYIEDRTGLSQFCSEAKKLFQGYPLVLEPPEVAFKTIKNRITTDKKCKDVLNQIQEEIRLVLGMVDMGLEHNSGSEILSENLEQPISVLQSQQNQKKIAILPQQQQSQLQLQRQQENRPPFWWSVQYALQALEALGPKFSEFASLLKDFKTDRVTVEKFSADMKLLLGKHDILWSQFETCLEVSNTKSPQKKQQQKLQMQWLQWFNHLNYLTEGLAVLGPKASKFSLLWNSHQLENSISLEKLREGMEPLLKGHAELWSLFQSYVLSGQQ